MLWTYAEERHRKLERIDKKELNRSDPISLAIRMMKLDVMSLGMGMRRAGGVENVCSVTVENPEGSRPLGVPLNNGSRILN
jgi:hypothetical protein